MYIGLSFVQIFVLVVFVVPPLLHKAMQAYGLWLSRSTGCRLLLYLKLYTNSVSNVYTYVTCVCNIMSLLLQPKIKVCWLRLWLSISYEFCINFRPSPFFVDLYLLGDINKREICLFYRTSFIHHGWLFPCSTKLKGYLFRWYAFPASILCC